MTPTKTTAAKATPTKAAPAKKAPAKKAAAPKAAPPKAPTTSSAAVDSLFATDQVYDIALTHLHENPDNIRANLGALDELAKSIEAVGILQPLLVEPHPTKKGHYLVIAGHRRTAAARMTTRKTAPAMVRDTLTLDERAEIMLIENLQREGLAPLDEARGFQMLVDAGWTQHKIADRVGCAQSHVSKRVALLVLPDVAQQALAKADITIDDALALTKLAETPDVATKIVTDTVKAKKRGNWVNEIPQQVARVERDRSDAEKIAEIEADCEAKGITILERIDPKHKEVGTYHLDVDSRKHAKEPCHAVSIGTHYEGPRAVPYCTDPARHTKKGDSELKVPSNRERATQQMTPAQRAERERTDLRRSFVHRLLDPTITASSGLPDAGVLDALIERRYLADAAHDERQKICRWLGIEPIEVTEYGSKRKDYDTPMWDFANKSGTNRRRACLAFACVQAEWGYGFDQGEYLQLLVTMGYEPDVTEKKLLKTAPTPAPVAPSEPENALQLDGAGERATDSGSIDVEAGDDDALEPEIVATDTGDVVNTATGEIIEHAPEGGRTVEGDVTDDDEWSGSIFDSDDDAPSTNGETNDANQKLEPAEIF